MGDSRTKFATLLLCSFLSLAMLACGGGSGGGGGGDTPGEAGSGGSGGDGGTGGGENPGGSGGDVVNPNLPRIDALEPDHGIIGARVNIIGANFVTNTAKIRVTFAGAESAAFSVSPDGTRIETAVPLSARTGQVVVLNDGVRVEGPVFTVDPNPAPVLVSLNPARVPARREATITLGGTGFLLQSRVLMDGVQVSASVQSGSRIDLHLSRDALATAGRRQIQVVTDPPGGGTSEARELEVFETIDLVGARATGATSVRLTFDTAVNSLVAADPRLYTFNGGLQTVAAAVDTTDNRRVVLTTSQQQSMFDYVVTVASAFRSAAGGELVQNRAEFWGYRTLPQPAGQEGGTGCGSNSLSGPAGITLENDGYFVVERTGHQVQLVSRQRGNLTRFFGHDGNASGEFEEGHEALGCPGDVGSSMIGAFSGPMGKVVLLANEERLVSDTGNDRMVVWSRENRYLREFGSGWDRPVLLGSLAGQLWVAGGDDTIRLVDDEGTVASSFGGTGSAPGEFRFGIEEHVTPAAVEFEGWLVVIDPLNHRIQRFRNPGEPGEILGGGLTGWSDADSAPATCCDAGTGAGYFTRPRGLTVWEESLVVVDEAGGGRFVRLQPDGTTLAEMQLGFIPSGMAVTPGFGRLWILDESNNRIRYYR
jgi:hypothetical protein